METGTTHTCKNCGNNYEGKYCNQCGEKVFSQHDKSVFYIIEELFHFLTHFEGSFFTTIKTIFSKPGKVSRDYSDGIRKKYYKPVSLFFLLIVVYLLFPGFFPQGLNMSLENHQGQPYKRYVAARIEEKMQKEHISYEVLAEKFQHESNTVSKGMLLILLPITALILMGLNYRKGIFFDHFMLSTEINAFHLIFGFLLMPVIIWFVFIICVFVFRINEQSLLGILNSELTVTIMDSIVLILFCVTAFRRFYGATILEALIKTVLFWFFFYFTVYVLYKFLLFATVMALI